MIPFTAEKTILFSKCEASIPSKASCKKAAGVAMTMRSAAAKTSN
jgi:hypothetical protein